MINTVLYFYRTYAVLRTLTKLNDFPLHILTELRRLTNYVV